ncbi:hypothetical protein NGB36_32005 [Streptomyces sp. RB6PN25]|uniref:Cobyrinic acid a,c-diamide synthase n=1 Tax=Streptomyces humicola TaxID=2953240 RepID=A0ABT1Q558_9ACTN|nr:hypothetical protein [Streptomyces humicola]MCQ4085064.1 hypothetical protein [Streptomyces humicola]
MSLPGADELFRTTGGMALQSTSSRQHSNGETAGPQAGERLRPVPVPADEDGQEQAARERAGDDEPGTVSTVNGTPGTPAQRENAAQEPSAAAGGTPAPGSATTAEHTRPTADGTQPSPVTPAQRRQPPQEHAPAPATQRRRRSAANRRPSGRERHDEKITVYVSAEELMDLEHARLVLRGEHGLAVDRGRIVREAVAVVLADLESRGDASILVRRLRGR